MNYFLQKTPRALGADDFIAFAGNASAKNLARFYSDADTALVSKAKPIALYVACKYAIWEVAGHLAGEPSLSSWASKKTGRTALMEAAYHGNTSVVRKLLGSGADVLARDSEGNFALLEATLGAGDAEVVENLAEAMADASAGPVIWADSMKAVSLFGTPADLKAIVKTGFSPDRLSGLNRFELILNACRRGSIGMARLLMVSDVDWLQADKEGNTALLQALAFRNRPLAKWISSQREQRGIILTEQPRLAAIIATLKVGVPEVLTFISRKSGVPRNKTDCNSASRHTIPGKWSVWKSSGIGSGTNNL